MNVIDFGLVLCGISLLLMVYPYLIYPAILSLCKKWFSRPVVADYDYTPTVSVLISAYNEEDIIAESLTTLLASDYPADKVTVWVADDGSEDATSSRVEAIAQTHPQVNLVVCHHRGKNAALDVLLSRVESEVIVFMDADCRLRRDALRHLIAPLADSAVGAVLSSNHRWELASNDDQGSRNNAFYRKLQEPVIIAESALHSTVISQGPLYAVKADYVKPINHPRVADDFFVILNVMRARMRVVKQPLAVINECRTNSMEIEMRRTVRTVSAGISALWCHRSLLYPTYGWVTFFLWSHRILRWLPPFFLIMFFIGTWFTLESPLVFGILFYGQFALYGIALFGRATAKYGQSLPLVSFAEYFVLMNIALFIGWVRFFSARSVGSWKPGQA